MSYYEELTKEPEIANCLICGKALAEWYTRPYCDDHDPNIMVCRKCGNRKHISYFKDHEDERVCRYCRMNRKPRRPTGAKQRPRDKSGYVYLIASTVGSYKIGRTKDIHDRLRTFNVKLPFEVQFIHHIQCEDMYIAEKLLHRFFASKRIKGSEWFLLTDQDVEYIKQVGRL